LKRQNPKQKSYHFSFAPSLLFVMAFSSSLAAAAGSDWIIPERKSKVKNPVASDAASLAAGEQVYMKECAICHGETGKGDGPGAKENKVLPLDFADPKIASQADGALFWKITVGRKPMPAFKKLLTDTQRWQVVNYMKKLINKGDKS
jgi:mono/diheme cytochrome c family protein